MELLRMRNQLECVIREIAKKCIYNYSCTYIIHHTGMWCILLHMQVCTISSVYIQGVLKYHVL